MQLFCIHNRYCSKDTLYTGRPVAGVQDACTIDSFSSLEFHCKRFEFYCGLALHTLLLRYT